MAQAATATVISAAATLLLAGCATAHEPGAHAEHPAPAPAPGSAPARQHARESESAWREAERETLRNHVRITDPAMFRKAGEAYFSPDGGWIIFQAIPHGGWDEGASAEHYSMYVGSLARDADGRITGLQDLARVSPDGSANTCGWFHPTAHGTVLFGSTMTPPADEASSGYQREQNDYRWQFPEEMEIVTAHDGRLWRDIAAAADALGGIDPGFICLVPSNWHWWTMRRGRLNRVATPYKVRDDAPSYVIRRDAEQPKPLFERHGYDAEGSYSPDGRFVLYSHVKPGTTDGDLWVFDTQTGEQREIVTAPGYDGGPFFSSDGKFITYRSDRAGNDLLQVFVAKLSFDAEGVPSGIEWEREVTANEQVNWAPFWSPDGSFLVYATSEVSHRNYEVFSIEAPVGEEAVAPADLKKRRITRASGFDGLPVFSADGSLMMWTSQRMLESDPDLAEGERPSSQVWIAEVVGVRP